MEYKVKRNDEFSQIVKMAFEKGETETEISPQELIDEIKAGLQQVVVAN